MTRLQNDQAVANVLTTRLADMQFAPVELICERQLLKAKILTRRLPQFNMLVDEAWGELNAFPRIRIAGEKPSEQAERRASELTRALWDAGIEYVQCRPQWLLEHGGILMLSNPDLLLNASPDLERFAPGFHMGTLIRMRMGEM